MTVMAALERLRQEDFQEPKGSLEYIMSSQLEFFKKEGGEIDR